MQPRNPWGHEKRRDSSESEEDKNEDPSSNLPLPKAETIGLENSHQQRQKTKT